MDSPTFQNHLDPDVNNNMNMNSVWYDENFRKLRLCRANVGQTMRDLQVCREYLQQWSSVFWRIEDETDEKLNADTFSKNRRKLEYIIQKHGLRPSQVYYLEEVLLRLMIPKNGSMLKGDHIRVLLCTNTFGEHKLTISVLGKCNPTPYITLPLHYCSQNSDWTPSVFEKWFSSFFVTEVSSFLLKNNLPPKAVLLTSRPRGECESEGGNFCSMCLPPCKNSIHDPLYKNLRTVYEKNIQILVKEDDPSVKNSAMYAVVRPWDNMKSEDIRKVFANVFDFETRKVMTRSILKSGKTKLSSLQEIPETETDDMEVDMEVENGVDNQIESLPKVVEQNMQDGPDYDDVPQQTTQHQAIESMKIVLSYFEQRTGTDSIEYLILQKIKQTINENRKRKSFYTTGNESKRRRK